MAEVALANDTIMEKHAKACATQVDYRKTRIVESPLAKSSDPFAVLARDTKQRTQNVVRRGSGSYSKGMGTSVALDLDTSIVAKFLDADMTMAEAINEISQKLAMRQKDRSRLSYWVGLREYLGNTMPPDSTVADCNPVVLSRSLARLAANVA
jgi:hypothetical protein